MLAVDLVAPISFFSFQRCDRCGGGLQTPGRTRLVISARICPRRSAGSHVLVLFGHQGRPMSLNFCTVRVGMNTEICHRCQGVNISIYASAQYVQTCVTCSRERVFSAATNWRVVGWGYTCRCPHIPRLTRATTSAKASCCAVSLKHASCSGLSCPFTGARASGQVSYTSLVTRY